MSAPPDGDPSLAAEVSSIPLSAYEVSHLVAHLEAARQDQSIHRLLALEASDDVNLWFQVKDAHGDLNGYLSDLRRALGLVRRTIDACISDGKPADDVGVELRYTLLIASVRGQARSVPSALLAELVARGLWSPETALGSVRQADIDARARALNTLAPHVPPVMLEQHLGELLAAARASDRTLELLTALGEYLPPQLLDEALDEATELESEWARSRALTTLSPSLTPEHLPRALQLALTIESAQEAAEALAALGPRLPDELRNDAKAAAKRIPDPPWQALALAGVGEPLPRDTLRQALATASGEDDWDRAKATSLMAPILPLELLGEAFAATQTLKSHRAMALTALAPHLPVECIPDALESTHDLSEYDRGDALAALAPRLSHDDLDRALDIARQIEPAYERIQALVALAQQLKQQARDEVLAEAFTAAEQTPPFSTIDVDVVATLLAVLPEQFLPRALALARKLNPDARVPILVALGPRLLEPTRSEVLREALHDSPRMSTGVERPQALARLALLLPGEVLPDVIAEERRDEDEWRFANRISELAPSLQTEELTVALRVMRQLGDEREQTEALTSLAEYLSEPTRTAVLNDTLAVIPEIRQDWDRAIALHALAPKLPESLAANALTIAKEVRYEAGARAIAEVAPAVPSSLLPTATAAVRASPYPHWNAWAFAALAATADEPDRSVLFHNAVEAAATIDFDEYPLASATDVLTQIAPELPDEIVGRALEAARHQHHHRWEAIAALAPRLPGDEKTGALSEALSAAREVHFEESRVDALTSLSADVPGVLEAIREISDPRWRAVGLARLECANADDALQDAATKLERPDCDWDDLDPVIALLPLASPGVAREALAAITQLFARSEWRGQSRDLTDGRLSRTLAPIVHDLDETALPELVNVIAMLAPEYRGALLGACMARFPTLEPRQLRELWDHARATLDSGSRKEVLETLALFAPAIESVGAEAGISETVTALKVVTRWLP